MAFLLLSQRADKLGMNLSWMMVMIIVIIIIIIVVVTIHFSLY